MGSWKLGQRRSVHTVSQGSLLLTAELNCGVSNSQRNFRGGRQVLSLWSQDSINYIYIYIFVSLSLEYSDKYNSNI